MVFSYIQKLSKLEWLFLSGILVCLVTFLSYINSFNGSFHMDDERVITPEIARYLEEPAKHIKFGRPRVLTDISFAFNYRIGEKDVAGYHVVNLSIHILNTFLVWMFISQLYSVLVVRKLLNKDLQRMVPFIAAFIFALHPIQTMAVTYIVQRYASAATLVYLLAVNLFVYSRKYLIANSSKTADNAILIVTYLLLGLLLLIGLHVKESIATLPLSLLLIDFIFFSKRKFNWKLIIITGGFVVSAILVAYRAFGSEFLFAPKETSLGEMVTQRTYLITEFRVLLKYIEKLILPINQNVDYYFPISKSFFEGAVLLGFCVWSSLVASIFLLRRKFPLIAFGIGWILITLLVESSILPIRDVINEYRLYLPMVGFSAIVSFTLFRFMPKLISKDGTLFVAALLLLTYAGLTFNRNFSYKDDLTFWLDASAKSPQKARPYVNSAVQYHLKGDWQNAVKQYDKALEIDPERLTALANKGVIYTQLKQFDQAKTYFNRALEIDNEYLDALNGLGVVSLNSNELDQAEELFNRVLSIEPTNNAALENLILVENAKGS